MRSPLLIQNGCVAAGDSPAVFRPVQRGRVARGHIAILALLFLLLILNYSARAQANTSSNSSEPSAASGELTKEAREAAAEAEEHAQFRHSWMVQSVAKLTGLNLDGAYWLCLVLNFAILPGMFRNRTASIQKAMQEARKASEDANRRLAEIEARLSRLDTEIAAMRATAEKEGAAEEARIKAAAEEDGRKIVESAEQEIAAAAKLARRELTNYAANLAVSLAARQIKVDPATDQALVQEFARELSPKNGGQDKN